MIKQTNYARLFVRSMSLTVIATIIITLAGYALRMILARSFTTAQLGLFFAVLAIPSLLGTVKHLGAGTALVKEMAEALAKNNPSRVKLLFRAFLTLELLSYGVTTVILFLLAKPLAIYYFKTSDAVPLIYLLMTASFFSIIDTVVYGVMLAKKNVKMIQLVNSLEPLLLVILVAFTTQVSATIINLALVYVFVSLIFALINWSWYNYAFKNIPTPNAPIFPVMKELFISGLPVLLGITGATVLSNIDTLVLTAVRNLSEVGVYNNAVLPTANLLRQLVKMISFLIPPVMTELFVLDKIRFSLSVERMQKYSFLVLVPLMVCLIVFSSWLLNRFFGAEYATIGTSALQILAFGAIGSSLFMINTGVLTGIGKYSSYAILTISLAGVSIIGNFFLVPWLHVTGAGIANTLAFTVGMIASTIMLYRAHPYRIPWREWIKAGIAGLLMYAILKYIILWLMLNALLVIAWWGVLLLSIVGIIIYFILLFILKAITFNEIRNLLKHVPIIGKFMY